MLREWDDLPKWMQYPEVQQYYDALAKRKLSLKLKRIFDLVMSVVLLIIMAIPMTVIAVKIVGDSHGGVLYRQERVTAYGKRFRIHKFRTMVERDNRNDSQITVNNDNRITEFGGFLRKYRLDELPQLIDVLAGDMSFVGARPETVKYVKTYTKEMRATLLLPAGITSEASIRYKDEARLLDTTKNIDKIYIEEVLPEKMEYNLKSIREFSLLGDLSTMIRTVFVVFGKK